MRGPSVLLALSLAACTDTQGTTDEPETDPAAIELSQITVGELVFDVRVAGPEDGAVVILLHGFPETSHEWRDVMPELGRAGFRVVAPDQRGYSAGARPSAIEDYALDELVGDVAGIADAIDAEQFHVAGQDWGAIVTWGVAARFPDRVLTATPISVPHLDAFAGLLADPTSAQYDASSYVEDFVMPGFEDEWLEDDAAGLRGAWSAVPAADAEIYFEVLGTRDALGAALDWYRANVSGREFTSAPIGNVSVPTTMIWSDQDIYLLREGVDLTASYVTGDYRLEIVEGDDHWVVDRHPDVIAALLLERVAP